MIDFAQGSDRQLRERFPAATEIAAPGDRLLASEEARHRRLHSVHQVAHLVVETGTSPKGLVAATCRVPDEFVSPSTLWSRNRRKAAP